MSAFIQGKGDVFGPISAVAGNIPQFDGTSGKIIKDGKAAPVGAIVGNTDTQTLSNKMFSYGESNYRPHGIIYVDSIGVATSGTSEQTMYTFNLPANMLSKIGDMFQIKVNGQSNTSAAGSRQQRLKINGTLIFTNGFSNTLITNTETVWTIFRYSATEIKQTYYHLYDDGTGRFPVLGVLGNTPLDFTVANAFTVTAQAATGTISFLLLRVELFPAP